MKVAYPKQKRGWSKNIIIICVMLGAGHPMSYAQTPDDKIQSPTRNTEWDFGVLAHSRGWGLQTSYSRFLHYKRALYMDINVYRLKHPKEILRYNPNVPDSDPIVFGQDRLNIVANLSLGQKFILYERLFYKNVRLDFNYGVGPNFAFLKPMYYNVRIPDSMGNEPRIVRQRLDKENYPNQLIDSRANILAGLGEMSMIPGLKAKASLSAYWGSGNTSHWKLEAGAMVDAFPTALPIFVEEEANSSFFLNLFITIAYGIQR